MDAERKTLKQKLDIYDSDKRQLEKKMENLEEIKRGLEMKLEMVEESGNEKVAELAAENRILKDKLEIQKANMTRRPEQGGGTEGETGAGRGRRGAPCVCSLNCTLRRC